MNKKMKKALWISLAYIVFLTIYNDVLQQLWALFPLPIFYVGIINITPIVADILINASGFAIIYALIHYFTR
ncbi:MAG: hypothetical protein ACTSRW_07685 [Candidatus Helarchaeota archaeon]